jgi:DNA-directed RNA polymerase subunit RPC12/RpoP
MAIVVQTKKCSECGKEYPVSEYMARYRDKTTTYTTCRECRYKVYGREYHKKRHSKEPWFVK